MADAKIVDDLPNIVIDEEGFEAAAFRYEQDAADYVELINNKRPYAGYSIKGYVTNGA